MRYAKQSLAIAFGALLLVGASVGSARAEMAAPLSAEEHLSLAASFRAKAGSYRQQEREHLHTIDSLRNSPASRLDQARGQRNARVEMAIAQEGALAATAQERAAEAEKVAGYHELRGQELKGAE